MRKTASGRFLLAQLSSFLATLVDFGITVFLKEVCGWWYLFSTSAGSVSGGVANFLLCRKWVFHASGRPAAPQALRYFLVWSGSILLNIGGVFVLTSLAHFNYLISKISTAILVGIFFNYLLQKNYVFKPRHDQRKTTRT